MKLDKVKLRPRQHPRPDRDGKPVKAKVLAAALAAHPELDVYTGCPFEGDPWPVSTLRIGVTDDGREVLFIDDDLKGGPRLDDPPRTEEDMLEPLRRRINEVYGVPKAVLGLDREEAG